MRLLLPLSLIGLYAVFLIMNAEITELDLIKIKKETPALTLIMAPESLAADVALDLPASLQSTRVDGQFSVDENGNLIISPQIKNVFDYFLMTLGENELPMIVFRIKEYISSQLTEPAMSQAFQVLHEYLEYKNELSLLSQSNETPESFSPDGFERLQQQLDLQSRVRREVMRAETVRAFFEFDEAYDQWSLERLKIGANPLMNHKQKQQALAQMEDELPEIVKRLTKPVTHHLELRRLQAQEEFSNEESRYRFYQQQLGESVAQRLKNLDERRSHWQSRLDNYFTRKQKLLDVEGLDMRDLQLELKTLQVSLFDERERLRLPVLEAARNNG